MGKIVITNNPMVCEKITNYELQYRDTSYLGILELVRDRVHMGHTLITHPLAGSVKPGETPYRTVLISSEAGELDIKSLSTIEESIITCKKLTKHVTLGWSERILLDFQLIDFDLIFGRI